MLIPLRELWYVIPIGQIELNLFHKGQDTFQTTGTKCCGIMLLMVAIGVAFGYILKYGQFETIYVNQVPFVTNQDRINQYFSVKLYETYRVNTPSWAFW